MIMIVHCRTTSNTITVEGCSATSTSNVPVSHAARAKDYMARTAARQVILQSRKITRNPTADSKTLPDPKLPIHWEL